MKPQAPDAPPPQGLAIYLLGPPRVERGGSPVAAPRGHKVWGLLAYLVQSGAPVSRKHLAGLLFEDAEDPLAALRWNLSELRRLLGTDGLRGDVPALPLEAASYVDLRAVLSGSWAQALCVPGLGRELLEGMNFPGSPAFEVWLATERRHLQAAAEAVLREAALARMAAGAMAEAAALAGRLVRHNPLDENYQALLVRSLAAAGDGVGAARQAAACRELFQRELGVQPGATLDAAMRTVTAVPTAGPATGRAAALAQLEAGEAAIGAGALDAGLQCLRRAIVEADATGDAVLRTRARVALGGALVHAARGRDEEGATALHEALAVGRDASPALAAAACRELGYVEFLRGRYERTLAWLEQAAPLAAGDRPEQARIAIVHGAALSDTAHYTAAIGLLQEAETLAAAAGDRRQTAYALSMLGRALLLHGDPDAAAGALDRSVGLAQQGWTAFVPWPQSLRAEVDLVRGDVDAAASRFEHAFALGCQIGDPCWEGIAGRGLGCVAIARGEPQRAVEILLDAIARCTRLPDAYLWGKAYALDALCGVAVAHAMPQASAWINDMQGLAARSGMRELTVRACLHRAALGDSASGAAARLLAGRIDNPALHALAAL
ncbi:MULTISPECIES: BTAD domain-containing putative transcriptional regulator [unclassified Polaromonas]|uniref:AfsR/SARP family transcriptional regulator n=1 Tax=unclassified Polaromonas TaxID=2638319 RepID=UPI000F087308|nr:MULTISPECIES: BTAD domain-containing putative transcriptional regulator [unclassified Polaromonas]AYQ27228.1 SARP family transcriptional regulator [Polaromonas sp. SP1]QGJ17931.1 SARP family transcriptional regulator [Polaromonas sp. Pch-P]